VVRDRIELSTFRFSGRLTNRSAARQKSLAADLDAYLKGRLSFRIAQVKSFQAVGEKDSSA
jgi:hypothetical protein